MGPGSQAAREKADYEVRRGIGHELGHEMRHEMGHGRGGQGGREQRQSWHFCIEHGAPPSCRWAAAWDTPVGTVTLTLTPFAAAPAQAAFGPFYRITQLILTTTPAANSSQTTPSGLPAIVTGGGKLTPLMCGDESTWQLIKPGQRLDTVATNKAVQLLLHTAAPADEHIRLLFDMQDAIDALVANPGGAAVARLAVKALSGTPPTHPRPAGRPDVPEPRQVGHRGRGGGRRQQASQTLEGPAWGRRRLPFCVCETCRPR